MQEQTQTQRQLANVTSVVDKDSALHIRNVNEASMSSVQTDEVVQKTFSDVELGNFSPALEAVIAEVIPR